MLPPCVVDGRSRNPLYYYYIYSHGWGQRRGWGRLVRGKGKDGEGGGIRRGRRGREGGRGDGRERNKRWRRGRWDELIV